jgi:hypothetical protein
MKAATTKAKRVRKMVRELAKLKAAPELKVRSSCRKLPRIL